MYMNGNMKLEVRSEKREANWSAARPNSSNSYLLTPNSCKSRAAGFTMVELLTVLAIMVIVAAISIPAFAALFAGNNMVQAQNQLSTAVAGARTLAIQNHTDVALIFFEEPGHTGETAYAYEKMSPGGYFSSYTYFQPMLQESVQYLPKGVYVATLIGGVTGTPAYDYSGLALPPTVTTTPYVNNNADRAIVFNANGHLTIVNQLNVIWPETTAVPTGSTNWGTINTTIVGGVPEPNGTYTRTAVNFGPSSPGFILFEPANLPAADTAKQAALGTYLAANSDITMISTYTGNVIQ